MIVLRQQWQMHEAGVKVKSCTLVEYYPLLQVRQGSHRGNLLVSHQRSHRGYLLVSHQRSHRGYLLVSHRGYLLVSHQRSLLNSQ